MDCLHSEIELEEGEFFSYSETLDENTIRLVTIESDGIDSNEPVRCKVTSVPLKDAFFFALSYEWSEQQPTRIIFLNGKPFEVRCNLFSFLQAAPKSYLNGPDCGLWIDAICIDQSNIEEKNQQVRMMGSIYSQALRVLVWLGLSASVSAALLKVQNILLADDSPFCPEISTCPTKCVPKLAEMHEALAEDLLSYFDTHEGCETWQYHPYLYNRLSVARDHLASLMANDSDLRDAYESISRSGYWNRAWILQEILSARGVYLPCPQGLINFRVISDWLEEVENGVDLARSLNDISLANRSSRPALEDITKFLLKYRCETPGSFYGSPDRKIEVLKNNVNILNNHTTINCATAVERLQEERWPLERTSRALVGGMQLSLNRACLDIRDRINSVISFAPVGTEFPVNYKDDVNTVLSKVINFFWQIVRADQAQSADATIADYVEQIATRAFDALEIQPPEEMLTLGFDELKDSYCRLPTLRKSANWYDPQNTYKTGISVFVNSANLAICWNVSEDLDDEDDDDSDDSYEGTRAADEPFSKVREPTYTLLTLHRRIIFFDRSLNG